MTDTTTTAAPAENTRLAKRDAVPVAMSTGGAFAPRNLQEAIELAKIFAASGMLPKHFEGNPGAVLLGMQLGAELGLSPIAALQNIYVVGGRPTLWGDAVLAVVKGHPDCEYVKESIDTQTMTATCVVKRRGSDPITGTFSMADAKTANLQGKQGPWTQYPKRMLQMRARAFACRDAFPDALRGIGVYEEARDIPAGIDPDGVVNAKLDAGDHPFGFQTAKPAETATEQTPPPATKTAARVMDEKDKSEAIETKKKPRGQQTLPDEREAGQD